MENQEIWKPIKGYEEWYDVSSLGNVRSKDRLVLVNTKGKVFYRQEKGKLLCANTTTKGYRYLTMRGNSKPNKPKSIHRLVMQTFVPNPDNKPCINHINGIKSDNRIENLEWCTYSENTRHGFDMKLIVVPGKPVALFDLNYKLINVYQTGSECAKAVGTSKENVNQASVSKRKLLERYYVKKIQWE